MEGKKKQCVTEAMRQLYPYNYWERGYTTNRWILWSQRGLGLVMEGLDSTDEDLAVAELQFLAGILT